jgi:hypothetical protein
MVWDNAKPSEKDHDLRGIQTRELWSSSQYTQPLHHLHMSIIVKQTYCQNLRVKVFKSAIVLVLFKILNCCNDKFMSIILFCHGYTTKYVLMNCIKKLKKLLYLDQIWFQIHLQLFLCIIRQKMRYFQLEHLINKAANCHIKIILKVYLHFFKNPTWIQRNLIFLKVFYFFCEFY